VHAHNGTGIVPTPKGVAIMPDKLRAIIAGLQEAERAAIEAGLIDAPPVAGQS
jgi:hypothetical protein